MDLLAGGDHWTALTESGGLVVQRQINCVARAIGLCAFSGSVRVCCKADSTCSVLCSVVDRFLLCAVEMSFAEKPGKFTLYSDGAKTLDVAVD